jgi:hypothetical protein
MLFFEGWSTLHSIHTLNGGHFRRFGISIHNGRHIEILNYIENEKFITNFAFLHFFLLHAQQQNRDAIVHILIPVFLNNKRLILHKRYIFIVS